ncbi:cupin domain-containing protein [Pseudonocardia sp. TRM90224]|uniref:cupin domain-containing protein n=1 Tax=Pseudonocardia sp. TRM90224 TaxID=2812678 RepID=UPI001E3E73FB|nr:cupin domain-containing protein [Pseudonocardia sp. TRM90224]
MTGATYRLSPHQTLTVRVADAELLEVESVWAKGGALPPAHFHPAQDERFEILEGSLRVLVGTEERVVAAGEVLEIPRGTVHAMTALDGGARAIWQTRPALGTEGFYAGMDAAVGRGGTLLDFAPVARAHTAEVRFVKPPPALQGPLFALLSVVAKVVRR